MRRRRYLTTGGAALIGGFAGCIDQFNDSEGVDDDGTGDEGASDETTGSSDDEQRSSSTGVLATAVSDDPETAIDDFESLVVTVEEIWLHRAEETNGDDGTRDDDGTGGEDPVASLTTDANGEVTFHIPHGAVYIAVTVAHDDRDAALEYTFDAEADPEQETEDGLAVEFVGDVEQAADATVAVTDDGDPVEDVAVTVEFDVADGGPDDAGRGQNDTTGDDTAATDDGGDDGRIVIDVDDAEVDLVEVQGDAKSFIDETELDVGEFESLKLQISDAVEFELVEGDAEETTVETPGNAPLQFNESFEIRENTRTAFTADFAPHTRGRNNQQGYLLKPVPSEIEVTYEPLDAGDGV